MNSLDQYDALQNAAGVLRRLDRGRLILRGEDRRAYLHGLLTNDILALTAGTGCYAALLTAQGRMISDMRVFELGDMVLLDLDLQLAPRIRDHLDTFVITEDVVVEDVTDTLAQVGIYGPGAGGALAAALGRGASSGEPAPDPAMLDALRPFDSRRWDFDGAAAFVLRTDDAGVAGFDVVVPNDRADVLVRALEGEGAVPVLYEVIEITRVEAGIPRFLVDMDTSTIPLEAGIEDRAISLTKGCYVGQEVIIRVLHRGGGRVAKKLVRIVGEGATARGDRLVVDDREVGVVTSATRSPRTGEWLALGYVHRDFAAPGTTLAAIRDGRRASVRVAHMA